MSSNPSGSKVNWQPTIPVDQNIYEISTTQKAALGTRLEIGDRVFHYALSGGALSAGDVAACPTLVASHLAGLTVCTTGTLGQKIVTLAPGSDVTSNQYAEGYMMVASGGNKGQMYRIKSHGSIGSAAAGYVTLYDDLPNSISSTDKLNLVPNVYKSLELAAEGGNMAAGVVPIAASSGSYFWLQTYGPACVKAGAAAGVGSPVHAIATGGSEPIMVNASTASAVEIMTIGQAMVAGTVVYCNPVFLTIRA